MPKKRTGRPGHLGLYYAVQNTPETSGRIIETIDGLIRIEFMNRKPLQHRAAKRRRGERKPSPLGEDSDVVAVRTFRWH